MKPPSGFTSMNVSLPRSQRDYVEARVASGAYGSASEFVRELLRRDEKEHAKEKLERLLLEGIESGPPVPMDEGFFDDLRKRVRQARKKKKKK
jgi:antitoxin ParD1/3/4